jgi:hypothetical protein
VSGHADFRLVDERNAYDRLAQRLQHREEAIAALTAERDRLRKELTQFKPEPMSQACRDGDHGQVCLSCRCLCHHGQAERDRLAAQVKRVRRVAAGAVDAIDDLLDVPNVRESQLRDGLARVVQIQRRGLAALDGGAS